MSDTRDSTIHIGADYSDEERLWLQAMDRYKRTRHRPYPTWREILCVLKSLGYRRVVEPGPLPTPEEAGAYALGPRRRRERLPDRPVIVEATPVE